MSAGHFSFSFTQNATTAMLKDLYSYNLVTFHFTIAGNFFDVAMKPALREKQFTNTGDKNLQ